MEGVLFFFGYFGVAALCFLGVRVFELTYDTKGNIEDYIGACLMWPLALLFAILVGMTLGLGRGIEALAKRIARYFQGRLREDRQQKATALLEILNSHRVKGGG